MSGQNIFLHESPNLTDKKLTSIYGLLKLSSAYLYSEGTRCTHRVLGMKTSVSIFFYFIQ